jgi:sugar lactone lactonase YvrE
VENRRTALRFPAKLAVSPAGLLAIADTGNHRILRVRLAPDGTQGSIESVIGAGTDGFRDGGAGDAQFRSPHGVAFLDDRDILVADTGNHAIRLIDAGGAVTTVAGTGDQARRRSLPGTETPGTETTLNSPWDVAVRDATAWIAMAGWHQLWRLDLRTGRLAPWTGSGAEAIEDGPPRAAALAQPSGLALSGPRLYFADSESSAIRYADLPDGSVTTIVGTGLFDFGDRDGAGDQVRLQHPLAVVAHDDVLLIADTYNNSIKRLDPVTRTVETWLGDAGLHEPGGLALLTPHLYIADTNNHRIVVADLSTAATSVFRLLEQ